MVFAFLELIPPVVSGCTRDGFEYEIDYNSAFQLKDNCLGYDDLKIAGTASTTSGCVMLLSNPTVAAISSGAIWTAKKISVLEGFSAQFSVTFKRNTALYSSAFEGFAFVIQAVSNTITGSGGSSLGYSGIPSIAAEFDCAQSSGKKDPSPYHISFHTAYSAPNDSEETPKYHDLDNTLLELPEQCSLYSVDQYTILFYNDLVSGNYKLEVTRKASTSTKTSVGTFSYDSVVNMFKDGAYVGLTASNDAVGHLGIISLTAFTLKTLLPFTNGISYPLHPSAYEEIRVNMNGVARCTSEWHPQDTFFFKGNFTSQDGWLYQRDSISTTNVLFTNIKFYIPGYYNVSLTLYYRDQSSKANKSVYVATLNTTITVLSYQTSRTKTFGYIGYYDNTKLQKEKVMCYAISANCIPLTDYLTIDQMESKQFDSGTTIVCSAIGLKEQSNVSDKITRVTGCTNPGLAFYSISIVQGQTIIPSICKTDDEYLESSAYYYSSNWLQLGENNQNYNCVAYLSSHPYIFSATRGGLLQLSTKNYIYDTDKNIYFNLLIKDYLGHSQDTKTWSQDFDDTNVFSKTCTTIGNNYEIQCTLTRNNQNSKSVTATVNIDNSQGFSFIIDSSNSLPDPLHTSYTVQNTATVGQTLTNFIQITLRDSNNVYIKKYVPEKTNIVITLNGKSTQNTFYNKDLQTYTLETIEGDKPYMIYGIFKDIQYAATYDITIKINNIELSKKTITINPDVNFSSNSIVHNSQNTTKGPDQSGKAGNYTSFTIQSIDRYCNNINISVQGLPNINVNKKIFINGNKTKDIPLIQNNGKFIIRFAPIETSELTFTFEDSDGNPLNVLGSKEAGIYKMSTIVPDLPSSKSLLLATGGTFVSGTVYPILVQPIDEYDNLIFDTDIEFNKIFVASCSGITDKTIILNPQPHRVYCDIDILKKDGIFYTINVSVKEILSTDINQKYTLNITTLQDINISNSPINFYAISGEIDIDKTKTINLSSTVIENTDNTFILVLVDSNNNQLINSKSKIECNVITDNNNLKTKCDCIQRDSSGIYDCTYKSYTSSYITEIIEINVDNKNAISLQQTLTKDSDKYHGYFTNCNNGQIATADTPTSITIKNVDENGNDIIASTIQLMVQVKKDNNNLNIFTGIQEDEDKSLWDIRLPLTQVGEYDLEVLYGAMQNANNDNQKCKIQIKSGKMNPSISKYNNIPATMVVGNEYDITILPYDLYSNTVDNCTADVYMLVYNINEQPNYDKKITCICDTINQKYECKINEDTITSIGIYLILSYIDQDIINTINNYIPQIEFISNDVDIRNTYITVGGDTIDSTCELTFRTKDVYTLYVYLRDKYNNPIIATDDILNNLNITPDSIIKKRSVSSSDTSVAILDIIAPEYIRTGISIDNTDDYCKYYMPSITYNNNIINTECKFIILSSELSIDNTHLTTNQDLNTITSDTISIILNFELQDIYNNPYIIRTTENSVIEISLNTTKTIFTAKADTSKCYINNYILIIDLSYIENIGPSQLSLKIDGITQDKQLNQLFTDNIFILQPGIPNLDNTNILTNLPSQILSGEYYQFKFQLRDRFKHIVPNTIEPSELTIYPFANGYNCIGLKNVASEPNTIDQYISNTVTIDTIKKDTGNTNSYYTTILSTQTGVFSIGQYQNLNSQQVDDRKYSCSQMFELVYITIPGKLNIDTSDIELYIYEQKVDTNTINSIKSGTDIYLNIILKDLYSQQIVNPLYVCSLGYMNLDTDSDINKDTWLVGINDTQIINYQSILNNNLYKISGIPIRVLYKDKNIIPYRLPIVVYEIQSDGSYNNPKLLSKEVKLNVLVNDNLNIALEIDDKIKLGSTIIKEFDIYDSYNNPYYGSKLITTNIKNLEKNYSYYAYLEKEPNKKLTFIPMMVGKYELYSQVYPSGIESKIKTQVIPYICGLIDITKPYINSKGECINNYNDDICYNDNKITCHDDNCVKSIEMCNTDIIDDTTNFFCPFGTIMCKDQNNNNILECRESINDCPKVMICPPTFYSCPYTLTCITDKTQCKEITNTCDKTKIRCADGTCVNTPYDCFTRITCKDDEMYCLTDNSCRKNISDCQIKELCNNIDELRCPYSNICVKDINECPTIKTCPIGYVRCSDNTCVPSIDKCIVDNTNECNIINSIHCNDGKCVDHPQKCSSEKICTKDKPVLCPNQNCEKTILDCILPQLCDSNSKSCNDGTCINKNDTCVYGKVCPIDRKILCSDNVCVSSINECSQDVEICPKEYPYHCRNGECRANLNDCPTLPYCDDIKTHRCEDDLCTIEENLCNSHLNNISVQSTDIIEINTKCNSNHIRCPTGECVLNKQLCPTYVTCAKGLKRCNDGLCVKEIKDCLNNDISMDCQLFNTIRCPMSGIGSQCVYDIESCGTSIVCPKDTPVRCVDSRCVTSSLLCPNNLTKEVSSLTPCPDSTWVNGVCSTLIKCTDDKPYKCYDGTCAELSSLCPKTQLCTTDKYLCSQGGCNTLFSSCKVSQYINCPPEKPTRCPYSNSSTVCVSSLDECPNPTISDIVNNNIDTIGICPSESIYCRDKTCTQNIDNCEEQKCPIGLIRCDNGQCVENDNDCLNSSYGCPKKQIRCKDGSCDRYANCKDISDNDKCDHRCLDGSCRDDCSLISYNSCQNNQFICYDGTCVNDIKDCTSIYNLANSCPSNLPYRCKNGICVEKPIYCPILDELEGNCDIDKIRCGDGKCVQYEEECRIIKPCNINEIRCNNGLCYPKNPSNRDPCPLLEICPKSIPYLCKEDTTITGICVKTKGDCYLNNGCKINKPIRCNNGLCIDSTQTCDSIIALDININGCPKDKPYKCDDNECVITSDQCRLFNTCYNDKPILCPDGTCVISKDQCKECNDINNCNYINNDLTITNCNKDTPIRCSDGTCKKYQSYFDTNEQCLPTVVCNNDSNIFCSDGTCYNDGCKTKQFKCQSNEQYCIHTDTCIDPTKECKIINCPQDYPIICYDGKCVNDVNKCNIYDTILTQKTIRDTTNDNPIVCYDGSKVTTYSMCLKELQEKNSSDCKYYCSDGTCLPTEDITKCSIIPSCGIGMYRCRDGTCSTGLDTCSEINIQVCDENYTLGADGLCYLLGYTPLYDGCDIQNPYQCSNGRCVKDSTKCIADNNNLQDIIYNNYNNLKELLNNYKKSKELHESDPIKYPIRQTITYTDSSLLKNTIINKRILYKLLPIEEQKSFLFTNINSSSTIKDQRTNIVPIKLNIIKDKYIPTITITRPPYTLSFDLPSTIEFIDTKDTKGTSISIYGVSGKDLHYINNIVDTSRINDYNTTILSLEATQLSEPFQILTENIIEPLINPIKINSTLRISNNEIINIKDICLGYVYIKNNYGIWRCIEGDRYIDKDTNIYTAQRNITFLSKNVVKTQIYKTKDENNEPLTFAFIQSPVQTSIIYKPSDSNFQNKYLLQILIGLVVLLLIIFTSFYAIRRLSRYTNKTEKARKEIKNLENQVEMLEQHGGDIKFGNEDVVVVTNPLAASSKLFTVEQDTDGIKGDITNDDRYRKIEDLKNSNDANIQVLHDLQNRMRMDQGPRSL